MEVAELIITRGEKTLLRIHIDRAEVCIGSNPTNDVVIPDEAVPEAIALLMDRGARRFRLRDLTAGLLRLNDKDIDGEELDITIGDSLSIGEYRLTLGFVEEKNRHGRTRRMTQHGGGSVEGAHAIVNFQGTEHIIGTDLPCNIGGNEDNDLVIDDPFLSAFHARISYQNGRWFLKDLDSTNGTEVNGLRVREAELPSPAKVKVGKPVFDFEAREGVALEEDDDRFHGMIAKSEKMMRVFRMVERMATASEPVLVVGESGSGKELVARALHDASAKSRGPYLALNCGALNPTLIESELFGYEKGTFTGADSAKEGAFQATSGGTLFLDEIGELPLELQPKLLRVLETKSVRRVGGNREIPVDTRIVAATHRNLEEAVEEGDFREDLFHRLFVLVIRIPPLAERNDDILPLARHFLTSQSPRPISLSKSAEIALLDYTWPGNIRELRNVLVRAILMTDADQITPDDLQFSRDAFTSRSRDVRRNVRRHDEADRQKMIDVLEKCSGNRAEAARMLGVSKSTFHDRLKRYGIGNKFGDRR